MNPQLISDLLERALEMEMGLVITTNNPAQMSYWLLEGKKGLARYDSLMVTIPSTPETVIITKKSVELNEPVAGDLPDV